MTISRHIDRSQNLTDLLYWLAAPDKTLSFNQLGLSPLTICRTSSVILIRVRWVFQMTAVSQWCFVSCVWSSDLWVNEDLRSRLRAFIYCDVTGLLQCFVDWNSCCSNTVAS